MDAPVTPSAPIVMLQVVGAPASVQATCASPFASVVRSTRN
jgi:hypothetical protein